MLAELGYKFSLQGADEGKRGMDALGGSFGALSKKLDTHGSGIQKKLDATALGFSNMASSIQKSLNLAKVAVGTFVAGKALGGAMSWMKGNPEVDRWKDFLRFQGVSDKELKAYEAHMTKMRGKIAGVGKPEYMAGIYGMRGMFGEDAEKTTKALESTLAMAKGMGPTTTLEQGKDMMRVFGSSFGAGKSPDETLAMIQKFGAQVPELLKRTTVEAPDVTSSMSHIAGLYSQLGQSPAEMLGDIGAVGGMMRQRTGEFLKALLSKQGEGYGKFAGSIGKEMFLAKAGVKTEAELPKGAQELLKKSIAYTTQKYSREAGELLAKDPNLYAKALQEKFKLGERLRTSRGFDLTRAASEAFGETAVSGIPAWTAFRTSGQHKELTTSLDQVDPASQLQKLAETQRSFTSQYDIFIQKSEDLGAAIKKPFQALGIELMKPYGSALDRIRENWTSNTAQMETNAASFAQTFLGSFSVAFGPLPGIDSTLKSIVDSLGDPDPEKWKQIGADMGKLAGTTFGPLVSDLKEIAGAARDIASVVPSLRTLFEWTVKKPLQGFQLYGEHVVPDIADKFDQLKANVPEIDFQRVREPAQAAVDWVSGAWKSLTTPQAPQPTGPPPAVNVEVKPQIQIGNEEIREFIVKEVESQIRSDYAAGRRGFGEAWGW